MFENARLKLTGYYTIIILLISGLFSLIIYGVVSRQIERLAKPRPFFPDFITIEIIEEQKQRLAITLIWIDSVILVTSALAGYFLAGRTLRPIKEMLDEQNQFISDASHELRTPIATLRAEMEGKLLEATFTEKEARELIYSNLEELDRLQTLSDKLLRLTKSGSRNKNKVSINRLLDKIKEKMQPLADSKNINILIQNIREDIKVENDPITEVMLILIDNAIKYSPKNSKVEIRLKNTGKNLTISVKDQGIGITSEEMPHIFERFYRADKSRSEAPGYGLGLSIAKKIIDEIHGQIQVESKPGKGSIFSLILPI